jgi:ribosomal protein L7/L12
MEYILVAIFASAFVLAIFWFVAKTIGKLRVVKNSPTLDDIADLINPGQEGTRASAHEERSLNAESLPEAVKALADAGDKLAAVRAYKDQTGVSLMEAKKTIEDYLNKR